MLSTGELADLVNVTAPGCADGPGAVRVCCAVLLSSFDSRMAFSGSTTAVVVHGSPAAGGVVLLTTTGTVIVAFPPAATLPAVQRITGSAVASHANRLVPLTEVPDWMEKPGGSVACTNTSVVLDPPLLLTVSW